MSGKLGKWTAAYDDALERVRHLLDGISGERLNLSPGPGRWSVGQCVDHLTVSMRVYLDPMEPVVEEARAAGRTGAEPYGNGPWIGRLLLRALREPGKRYPAPRQFRPRDEELDPAAVRAEFEEAVGRLRSAAERAQGLALGEVRMPWPAFRLVPVSLAQAFDIQAVHLHRHLDQAEGVAKEVGA